MGLGILFLKMSIKMPVPLGAGWHGRVQAYISIEREIVLLYMKKTVLL
jgi:hypothetical protein